MQVPQRVSEPARLVTAEEFAKLPDDDYRYELVAGRVIRMSPPGVRHGRLAVRLALILERYVEVHRVGVVLGEAGCHIASNPDTVRGPDLSFFKRERIPAEGLPEGFWPGPPDLVVEIRSPGDRRSEIQAKVDDYLTRGVSVVWVVDPKRKTVTIHRRLAPSVTLHIDDELDGGDVVVGFTCKVSEIFNEAF